MMIVSGTVVETMVDTRARLSKFNNLALPLSSSVTFSKLLNFSEPLFFFFNYTMRMIVHMFIMTIK